MLATTAIATHKGFTRWALLVALAIIGLLALAVGPRLFGDVTLAEIATAKVQVLTGKGSGGLCPSQVFAQGWRLLRVGNHFGYRFAGL